jgi:type III secretion system YscJ/HrcJ family lipoprotein
LTPAPPLCEISLVRTALVGIACLLASCSATLERGLDEAQADAIVVALADHGIGASKDALPGGDGFAVTVGASDVATALAVLREEGLPRVETPGLAEAYATPSLVPTAGEERARTSTALAADLARSIQMLEGVRDARVHLGLPDPSVVPIDDEADELVASVLVRTEGDAPIDEPRIRALVAGAVAGLSPERVTVIRTPVRASAMHAEPLVTVGPIYVTAGSVAALRATLAGLLGVNVLLAIAVGLVVRRRRR